MTERKTVDLAKLQTVEQDDIMAAVRFIRAMITNLRVYPAGHRVVSEVVARIADHLRVTSENYGTLLFDAEESTLRCNGEAIYKACPERDDAVMVAAWLRERGLTNLVVGADVSEEDLLALFGWLNSTPPRDARESFDGGRPAEVDVATLGLNARVRGGRSEEADELIESALSSVDVEGVVRDALTSGEFRIDTGVDPEQMRQQLLEIVRNEMSDSGATAAPAGTIDPESIDWAKLDLTEMLDQDSLEEIVADYLENDFQPDALIGAGEDIGERLEEIAEKLKDTLNTEDLGGLQQNLMDRAATMVGELVPDALGRFLGDPANMGTFEQVIQQKVIDQLAEQQPRRLEVMESLVDRMRYTDDPVQFDHAIHGLEQVVPEILGSAYRKDGVRALAAIAQVSRGDLSLDSRLRAESALRVLAGPDLLPRITHELRSEEPQEREQARELLCNLGRDSITPLLEVLRTSLDQEVRLAIVGVLVEMGRRESARGDSPVRLLVPVLREVRHYDHNPWYFTRNLVEVLARVGAPTFEQELLKILDADLDYRVLAGIALGLADSQSEDIREALRALTFSGRLTMPDAFEELLLRLYRWEPERTLDELDQMLIDRVAPDRIERIALDGLAQALGADSVPILEGLLTARSRILRRPVHRDELRLMAVEALSLVDDDAAREALARASKDPADAVRERAAQRLAQGPIRASLTDTQETPWE
jgi:HEAT repeat protein